MSDLHDSKTHTGGCHCGKVRFEAKTGLDQPLACNCSICQKTGSLLKFVPAQDFKMLSGDGALTDYQFNKKMIHHFFCPTCGIRSFAHGKGPDGTEMFAVNIRCLDDVDLSEITPVPFDGKSL
jgi:hypothetical protein